MNRIPLLLTCLSLAVGCAASGDDIGSSTGELRREVRDGRDTFQHETFDGNDRTCETCHRLEDNGTISPQFIAGLDDDDPIFRSVDSDDGMGDSYEQLREHATFRVTLQLPRYLRRCADLEADTFTVRRSAPSVENVGLENALGWSMAATDLETQAAGAIAAHFNPGRAATETELSNIAAFQETLFSHGRLRGFFNSGNGPELPQGGTPAQQRGREHFLPDGRCGNCHGGPMLNEITEFHPLVQEGIRQPGERTAFVLVGTLGRRTQPVHQWCILNPRGEVVVRTPAPFPDPGIAINTFPNRGGIIGGFKIPTLWGAADTAPYFHDNSARDLQEVMDHYNLFFASPQGVGSGDPLTAEEQADAIAYLQLLGRNGNGNN